MFQLLGYRRDGSLELFVHLFIYHLALISEW